MIQRNQNTNFYSLKIYWITFSNMRRFTGSSMLVDSLNAGLNQQLIQVSSRKLGNKSLNTGCTLRLCADLWLYF